MAKSRRVSNGLVGLGSAAVMAIYATGYAKTRPAAARFAHADERRPTPAGISAPAPENTPPKPAETAAPMLVIPPDVEAKAAAAAPPSVPASVKPRPSRTPRVEAPPTTAPVSSRPKTKPVAAPVADAPVVTAPAVNAALPAVANVAAEPVPATSPAPVPQPEAAAPVTPPAGSASPAKWKDGTFLGWGTSRHGDIQAQVEVRAGRIVSATIAQCLTRYSCSWISPLPPQVVTRQSPEVDYVSGATQSTNAFYDAVVDALSKAK